MSILKQEKVKDKAWRTCARKLSYWPMKKAYAGNLCLVGICLFTNRLGLDVVISVGETALLMWRTKKSDLVRVCSCAELANCGQDWRAANDRKERGKNMPN